MSTADAKLEGADELTRKRFQLFRERFYGKLLARFRKDAPAYLQ